MTDRTIAHYEIIGKLGQGGMGEVYRATDTKLDREVAIKVLPKSFAEDATRLARFEREAKVLAALNHPNIAVIYSIEQSVETQALIMELVEGETLGERLQREPMTIPEALDCCRQIANALEAAHDKGIIHRDLKPENVKIDQEGRVKVLDFGLAKEVVDPASSGNQAESPTITHMTTVPGELLGTAPYMSPEQARGRPVDKRSDIWAFGCVLYECLTGKSMFGGEDVSETLASIIKGEPDWTALPEDTPPTIELLLRKCLNKDRKRRLHDIADARIDIEQALGDPSSSIIRLSEGALRETNAGRGVPRPLVAGLVAGVAIIALALGWFLKPASVPAPPPVRRVSMDLGVQGRLAIVDGSAVQFSPDGSMVAFMAVADDGSGGTRLYVRPLDQLKATPLDSVNAVDEFCFSPDGRWIAFRDYEDNTIKKVTWRGGSATPLCRAKGACGIDWSNDGWILFAEATGGLLRVSDNGGTPEPLTTLTGKDVSHRWPHLLPDGKSILYTARATQGGSQQKIMFQRLPDGKAELVATSGSYPLYVPGDYVVFLKGHRLFGVPFDPNAGLNGAEPVPLDGLLGGWVFDTLFGAGHFDVSADGSLIYFSNNNSFNLEWVDRAGNHEPVLEGDSLDSFFSFDLSRDGHSLVYNNLEGGGSEGCDLWVYDITRPEVPRRRLTFVGSSGDICIFPVWSPSGKCIVYTDIIPGQSHTLFWRYADGSGEAHKLYRNYNTIFPRAWYPPDGTSLLLYVETPNGASDVRLLELKGDDSSGWQAGDIKEFNPTPYGEFNGSFSPDGKWLAYDSDETGRRQIYVCSFPDLKNPRQVTSNKHDAYNPIWSDGTNELLYMTLTRTSRPAQIYSVPYSVEGKSFIPEEPVPWPSGLTRRAGALLGGYDYDPEGNRLLVRTPAGDETASLSDRLVLVEGFADELRKQLATNEK